MRLRRSREGAAAAFARAGRPRASTPWRQARWCALDLELTGLDPRADHIIAIGSVAIEAGRVVLGESSYTLVSTSRRSDDRAVLAHKLRVADLRDAPPVSAAVEHVLERLTGAIPVFHAAAVERTFLSPLLARRGVRLPAAADTQALASLWLRQRDGAAQRGLTLGALASTLGQATHPAHHALGDALTTAQAFIALASHLDGTTPQTVGSLLSPVGRY